MSLLSVKNLHITTPIKPLVQNVSFSLKSGQTLAIVGESGSGKTLSSLAIMGLLAPELTATADSMAFNDTELQTLTPHQRRSLRGRAMSMVFQEPATALNPVLTVGYQVEEAFIIHTKLPKAERRARVLKLFAQVQLPNPTELFGRYPHQLSGGQRQRVCIAMALAHSPALLIADEPTTALDVTVQAEIIKLVKDLQQSMGMAMLWVTHDFGVVKQLATDVLVMQHGQVAEYGPAKQVLTKPKAPYTQQLLAAMPTLNTKALPSAKATKKPLLTAAHLSLSYPANDSFWPFKKATQRPALSNVSFTLARGQTLGVVGESGSGKSTLAKVLTQLLPAQPGAKVVLLDKEIGSLKGESLRLARKDLQMVFQDPAAALNPKMQLGQSVAEGIVAHNLMPKADIPAYVANLFAQCGLPADAITRYPHQLSGGQKQRVCIARALALQPQVIIADEAVSALDVTIQSQILQLFQTFQRTHGTSFIFISHDLRVVSHLAHHVLVMHQGRVVEQGPTHQVFTKPQHAYTQKLLAAVI